MSVYKLLVVNVYTFTEIIVRHYELCYYNIEKYYILQLIFYSSLYFCEPVSKLLLIILFCIHRYIISSYQKNDSNFIHNY